MASLKLRTIAAELLAAITVLSVVDGHKLVLAAMSEYRIAFDEAFRFEHLVALLRLPDPDNAAGPEVEEDGIWEARTAALALINAITNCPDDVEERVLLREEFGRRGLNEAIVVCCFLTFLCLPEYTKYQALRYIKPPESLLTQIDVYTEEKYEDEEDMRERARNLIKGHARPLSESDFVLGEVLNLAKQHGEVYPIMMETLKRYALLLEKEMNL